VLKTEVSTKKLIVLAILGLYLVGIFALMLSDYLSQQPSQDVLNQLGGQQDSEFPALVLTGICAIVFNFGFGIVVNNWLRKRGGLKSKMARFFPYRFFFILVLVGVGLCMEGVRPSRGGYFFDALPIALGITCLVGG
jgi:hypothetical protein